MSVYDSPDADTFRIMVATDNHLGYMERDPVRGKDSFAAFEEVLLLAKQRKVDFVLLGGDLFHENKPSRRTLYRTMDILRRHCMGDEPVSFEIISEQAHNFRNRFGHVNYEDPYFSVGLPIFSIHGNHDDPTREGGVEALAALDLLHVANLVNYFGKSDRVDDVEVNPILMQKGSTKLALYGLGSMRDERLNRMWHQKKVRFLRPKEDESPDGKKKEFFKVFVLHQNRDLGRGKKNCVHESMIPEWMDLVVWGHEHECKVEIVESLVGTFRITQPGSSVATSLCEGEAVPKHTGLLEIRGNDFRLLKMSLSQVRPFRVGDIVLNNIDGLDSTSANVDEAVAEALAKRVEQMVIELHKEEAELEREPPEGQEYLMEKRDQVLVRLKVEHSDFPTLNNQRFGSQFMGKVANPSDMLLFYRRRNFGATSAGGGRSGPGGLSDPIRPDSLDDMRVEDLVMENLERADKKLSLLVEPKLKAALEDYVHKGDAQAMNDLVKETLEGAQRTLRKEKAAGNAAMIDDAVAMIGERERAKLEADRIRKSATKAPAAKANAADTAGVSSTVSGRAEGGGSGGGRRGPMGGDFSDDDNGNVPSSVLATGRTGVRGGEGARGGGGSGVRRGGLAGDDGVSDGDEDMEEDYNGVGKKAGRRGDTGQRVAEKRRGGRGHGAHQAGAADGENSFDEVEDDGGGRGGFGEAAGRSNRSKRSKNASSSALGGRRVSARAAGGRGKVSYAEDEDSDGDGSEVEEIGPPRGWGKRKSAANENYDDDDDFVDEPALEDESSEFQPREDDYDDDEEGGRGRGRRGGGSTTGKRQGKVSTAAASSSRSSKPTTSRGGSTGSRPSARSGTSAGSRGKRRGEPQQPEAATSQASSFAGGSRKRRLPAWATAASSGRDEDDVEEISSAVSAWGEAR